MTYDRCVYLHKLNGAVVYVGSGCLRRIKSKTCRTKEHLAVWEELTFEAVVTGLDKDTSLVVEQALIDAYSLSGKLLNKHRKVAKTFPILYNDVSEKLKLSPDSPSWLRWKKNNKVAGSCDKRRGYYRVTYGEISLLAHRIVWALSNMTDLPVDCVVDHINRDVSDNSPENLRAVSQSDNCKNRSHPPSKTGIPYIYERDSSFTVRVKINDRLKSTVFSFGEKFQKKNNLSESEARLLVLEMAIKFRDKHLEQC